MLLLAARFDIDLPGELDMGVTYGGGIVADGSHRRSPEAYLAASLTAS